MDSLATCAWMDSELCNSSRWDLLSSQIPYLQQCLKQHDDCHEAVSRPENLPKRLIDVGDLSESSINPRLVSTRDVKERPVNYIALSHSWSTLSEDEQRSLSTTVENVDKHFQTLDYGAFPRNYYAVMLLCRSLGIRYMWLDSLCIIQVRHHCSASLVESLMRLKSPLKS